MTQTKPSTAADVSVSNVAGSASRNGLYLVKGEAPPDALPRAARQPRSISLLALAAAAAAAPLVWIFHELLHHLHLM